MPTVGVGAVAYRRLVTTSCPSDPSCSNSTPPAVSGAWNAETTMSSRASDSRGLRTNSTTGGAAGQGSPMKQRYVAATASSRL
jgi:hypothetical protein